MSFASKSFNERFTRLGDDAETAFEQWADSQNVRYARYGLIRPPFKSFYLLPRFIRMTPDYVCEGTKKKFLVECKGIGGKTVKIKHESIEELENWNRYLTVWFFIFDSNSNLYTFINFRNVAKLCQSVKTKYFPSDNKAYYDIPTKHFEWCSLSQENLLTDPETLEEEEYEARIETDDDYQAKLEDEEDDLQK